MSTKTTENPSKAPPPVTILEFMMDLMRSTPKPSRRRKPPQVKVSLKRPAALQ